MHSIKHQARNIAWRHNDGEANYNPFARRSRSYAGRLEDVENNLQRRHTADQVMSDSAARRTDARNIDNADFAYPHHANTAPPESSSSFDSPTSNGPLVGQSDIKPSREQDSLPLDRDNSRSMSEKNVTEHEHKPRKRLALMNMIGAPDRTKDDDRDLERSDTADTNDTNKKRRPKISVASQLKATLLGSWVNVLLVCVPVGFALRYAHSNGIAIFVVNFVAIIPLAAMLSFATEELAMYVGETLGGLLNASFGNATELIVGIIALAQNKILIVQTSLIGSMLSNLLLVLGMCFFFGGINRVVQHFNITVAQTASSMLAVSIGSLIIPTAFQKFGNNPAGGVAPISRGTAIILLLVYFAYLIFQLKTHVEIYNTPSQKSEKKKGSAREKGETLMGIARIGAGTAASAGGQVNQSNLVYNEDDEEETPSLTIVGALVTLTIATVLIAFNSEFMVSGIDYIVETGHISEEFVGLILVPIVGNAAEHATAVTVAIKDKMDLAIGVAVGSSMQIALLVLPLMVVISWCGLGHDAMTLDFDGFQVAVLFIAVLLVNYLIQDGESHWLEGILLMAVYIIIAVSAWFYPAAGDLVGAMSSRDRQKSPIPDDAEIIDLDNEPDHYTFANSDQEEVKVKLESTPETNATLDLGNSILQPKQAESDLNAMTEEELQAIQESFYSQYLGFQNNEEGQQNYSEPGEDIEDPVAQECRFMQDKAAYEEKKRSGQLTEDDERQFLKEISAYTKRKRELGDRLADEQLLFEPEERPRKKARTSKSANPRKPPKTSETTRSAIPNLRGHANFWESADAAEQMEHEPAYENVESGGRAAALKSFRTRISLQARRVDMGRLEKATSSFVNKKGVARNVRGIQLVDKGWTTMGMNTPLKNYQMINCGWMRRRELGTSEPRGGIIADQMGLGKTVTCLANIVNGRPLKTWAPHLQPESHTTLIIVPSTLVGQWRTEIKRHTKSDTTRRTFGLGSVYLFKDSASEQHESINFERPDIVLTTYYDVRRSWPDCDIPEGLAEAEREAFWMENIYEKRGPLHKHRFLRIVLDEGHQIANPDTLTAQACFNLVADHKWILTGTPMINGSKDLYSLFHFIGHPTVTKMKFEAFKSRFCNVKNPMSLDALSQEMVDSVACFTHKDKLFEARLITLPKPHNRSMVLNPMPLEIEIYNIVRARFKERAQTLNENGELRSNKFHIWAMHTLLRQLTAHPLMVPMKVCDYLEIEDFDKLEKAVDRQAKSRETPVSTIHAFRDLMRKQRSHAEARAENGVKLDMRESAPMDDLDEGIDEVEVLRAPAVIQKKKKPGKKSAGRSHGKNVAYGGYIESFKRSANYQIFSERTPCCKCGRNDNPVMTSCYHFYCHTHLEDLMHEAAALGLKHAICIKPGCGKEIERSSIVDPEAVSKPKWLDADGNVLPSTKTLAVKSQILNWLDPKSGGDRDAKCIVFCQWRNFLGLLGRICDAEKWEYVTLHGGMSKKTRDANIEKFKATPKIKILIATLKTGGQGLNLTCARYVLNVDPYWNTAGEIQAFSRVYRIGQEHETEFVNLTLAGTVDEHMNSIKERKKKEIDQVTAGHKKLTTEELLKTFEPVEEDTSEDTE
ncbi:Calcium/proton exchanger, partial [Aureobasidium melanogenum]